MMNRVAPPPSLSSVVLPKARSKLGLNWLQISILNFLFGLFDYDVDSMQVEDGDFISESFSSTLLSSHTVSSPSASYFFNQESSSHLSLRSEVLLLKENRLYFIGTFSQGVVRASALLVTVFTLETFFLSNSEDVFGYLTTYLAKYRVLWIVFFFLSVSECTYMTALLDRKTAYQLRRKVLLLSALGTGVAVVAMGITGILENPKNSMVIYCTMVSGALRLLCVIGQAWGEKVISQVVRLDSRINCGSYEKV